MSVQFAFRGTPAHADALRAIPGVVVAPQHGTVRAPENVAAIVARHPGVVPRSVPAPPAPVPATVVRRAAVTNGLHDWLWSDGPPTATAPVRLLPYQVEAICFAAARPGAHLWEPAGAGKTIQSIVWALQSDAPVLVITRAAARETHRREWRRFTRIPDEDIFVLEPGRTFDAGLDDGLFVRDGAHAPRVTIVGWSQLQAHRDALCSLACGASVIFDEAHFAKQYRREKWHIGADGRLRATRLANRSAIAAEIARVAKRRLCTTASPIANRPDDLWGQLTLAEPSAWGRTASRFLVRYLSAVPGPFGGLQIGPLSHADELKARLAWTVYTVPASRTHAELPPMRREVRRIPATDLVRAYRWNLRREEVDAARRGDLDRLAHYRLLEAASCKRKAVVTEVIEAIEGQHSAKILVMTGRRRDCDKLTDLLSKRLPTACWLAGAHGGTPIGERTRLQDAYMAHPGPAVLVGTVDAWGTSLNLQDTDLLLVVMLPYTPGMIEQLEGRVHRIGQTRPVVIRYLIAEGTYDEQVCAIVLDKLPAVEQVVGATTLDGLAPVLRGTADPDAVFSGLVARLSPEATP